MLGQSRNTIPNHKNEQDSYVYLILEEPSDTALYHCP